MGLIIIRFKSIFYYYRLKFSYDNIYFKPFVQNQFTNFDNFITLISDFFFAPKR